MKMVLPEPVRDRGVRLGEDGEECARLLVILDGRYVMTCDGGALDSVKNGLNWAYIGSLGLHEEEGWMRMYGVLKLVVPLGILVAALVVGLVGLLVSRLIARHTRRRRALVTSVK